MIDHLMKAHTTEGFDLLRKKQFVFFFFKEIIAKVPEFLVICVLLNLESQDFNHVNIAQLAFEIFSLVTVIKLYITKTLFFSLLWPVVPYSKFNM